MRSLIDVRLRDEARRFVLRFACDDCAHFAPGDRRCTLGYPPEPRRDDLARSELSFCKDFELA
jgi:hypothetical protein